MNQNSNLENGFVVNPESYWTPAYRISPFSTSFVRRNRQLVEDTKENAELLSSAFGPNYLITQNGKSAIVYALTALNVSEEDEVWLLTTSGNTYISSCVTSQIEKLCKWSRKKSSKTKVIFVNHEFGFCFQNLAQLREHNLPIIEDRALSFASLDEKGQTGTIGDFVIYSLPKFFPLNIGGILQGNNLQAFRNLNAPDNPEQTTYLKRALTHYLPTVDAIKRKRLHNYNYFFRRVADLGYTPRFKHGPGETAGVFMFRAKDLDLSGLKLFMQRNGIESSVFYGEQAFFLPVHQELEDEDIDFFISLIVFFKKNGNK